MMLEDINIELLEYYYLISIETKFDILIYAYNLKKEINKLQIKSLSYGYIIEEMREFKVTNKGNQRIKYLRRLLNLVGSERYVVPNFKYMLSRQKGLDDIYLD